MPKLTAALRAKPNDRGAYSTLVAAILGSGMFFGVMGLVLDVGQLMALKQQVRSAADSAAEAAATHCAKTKPGLPCVNDYYSNTVIYNGATTQIQTNADLLSSLANPAGVNDAAVAVTLCGKSQALLGLPSCPALTSDPNDCQTDLAGNPSYQNWVRAYATTDPAGFSPTLLSLGHDNPEQYQESACSQVYWGKADRISADTTGNMLPFALAICDLKLDSSATVVTLQGESTSTAACSVKDRDQVTYSSTLHGFIQWDASSATSPCRTPGSTTCTALALGATRTQGSLVYPPLSYSALITLMKSRLDIPTVLPVVTKVGSSYPVKGFVSFTLLGFRFPIGTNVTACSANSFNTTCYPGRVNQPTFSWGASCGVTQATTSPFCIEGVFTNRVLGGYGQVPGLAATNSSSFANLGYQVIRKVP